MAHTTSLDYVDDSEPERKRIRLQASHTKRQRRRQERLQRESTVAHDSPLVTQPPTYRPLDGDIISLEGSEDTAAEATPDHMESAVIDLTNVTDPSPKQRSESPSERPPETNTLHISQARSSAAQPTPSSDATVTQEVQPESNIISRLGHLAYRQVRLTSANMSDCSRGERRQSSSTSQVHHDKVEKHSQGPLTDSNVTKLDVGPLLRCVSCEVRWTVKKGTAHKLSHITTCARKNGMNPSTLQLLIERELLKIRHANANDKKSMPRSDSADAASRTYMESVVAEAQPKRKSRRADTAGTLQPVSQTRAAILDRARALLGACEVVPGDAPEPEQTQAFGRSKLATGHIQSENLDPLAAHTSEECALASRLALLRSMAGSPTTGPSHSAGNITIA
ncbi:hypothetical protein BC826DRAFT_965563 [Russula brevipes]|nr:hypothetical protein BC826DRAFT_965563 [Russula brevipes]